MFFQNKSMFETVKEEAYTVWRRLDPDSMQVRISQLESKTLEPGFWDDKKGAETLYTELNGIKDSIVPWKELIAKIDDMEELIDLYSAEPDNPEEEIEINEQISKLVEEYNRLKLKTLLNGKFDKNDCFLSIHAGAGGTEASDWANMLMRMYLRYCERNGFKSEVLDLLEDEGGIKSATIRVSGLYSFGYLKGEAGVHRLVRISPFDAQKRRHTSFTSVYASPVIDDTIEIDLKPEDYRLDTYRAGGAGGQHVNKTDSAVRITHYESGIVVQCQNERSQYMNKDVAFKVLRSRLYEYYKEKQEKEHQKTAIAKKEITWGSQIRSYVFQPYTMVKDHRTGQTVGNIQAVMDGDIDSFIESFLRWDQKE
ncbi:peptide chain release factor 2 [uncultured Sphaerochaeta sp.]|uniref:peptide chain release factor 2 n=1 Tax=uncultured Sphaerochaeta sp. TaxID=886478 RepID=UPI002A0A73D8|nr:peptide chain release factor 2 [uncultured Sphaerochaeta sp.]